MQRRLLLFLSIVFFALSLSACGELATPTQAAPDVSLEPELREVLRLVNEARSRGATCGGERFDSVAPVNIEARLTVAAQNHSEDMAAAQTMSHDTPRGALHYPAGSSPWKRVKTEGYSMTSAAENVAWGYRDAAAVMAGWLKSPGHCRNIMKSDVTELGLGLEDNYWTQVFASPR